VDYSTEEPTDPNAAVYNYPNLQPPGTLWYHDHSLGLTRINVLAGLAGFYFIRDPADQVAPLLPSGKYEVPLVLQDRSFNVDGSIWFPSEGANPYLHPYWASEYVGNTIMVNGAVWPKLDVDSGEYRFRVLDGSNARFYNLYFSNHMQFTVIGTDGSYLRQAVKVSNLLIGPGERYDILVDFSSLQPGAEVLLLNNAVAPYPDGPKTDPDTEGQVMKFTVTSSEGYAAKQLPDYLNPTLPADKPFPTLTPDAPVRILTLDEVAGAYGPATGLLNGQRWSGAVSELPVEGTTEDWALINLTEDAHTIHLHLVQFQLVYRQSLDWKSYEQKWLDINGELPFTNPTISVDYTPYLQQAAPSPKPLEQTWKDTIIVYPHMVTVIRVRFAPVDGSAKYSFDPTAGPGYVWHCHILDHEDNEMMRPYKVVAASPKLNTTITCTPSASDILKGAPIRVSGAITPAVADAVVTLTYTGGDLNVTRSATTGPDGRFNDTFSPTTAASWIVRALWIGNNAYVGSVSPPAQFTVTEPPSVGSIKITIRDSSGNPVQGATVSSTSTPGGQATLTGDTGSDGVITFNDVSPGSYTIQASKSGFTTQIVTAAVKAGETQDTSVTLQVESTGIPGYPFESVLVGFLVVFGALMLLARRRSHGVGSTVLYSRSSFSKHK
jgi:FtsP/CotA-like multicopper oxidase with cupredoxin domain